MSKKYVHGQSGVNGFFGITKLFEYLYQRIYQFIPGYDFSGSVFVAKTVTLNPRKGNTALWFGFKIKSFYPKSIWVSIKSFYKGYMLNAVGLSNPGLEAILKEEFWQIRDDFFHISIQLEQTALGTEKEIESICKMLLQELGNQKYALQLNESCPNKGTGELLDKMKKIKELKNRLTLFRELLPNGIELWVKFNALVDELVLIELKDYCDGYIISNTIPFGEAKEFIDWKKLFPKGSPLPKRLKANFEGGLSGAPVFPVLIDCLKRISVTDPTVNIIAGGGILNKKQIDELAKFRIVQGIALGCVALLRPWRLKSLIEYGNKIFEIKNNV